MVADFSADKTAGCGNLPGVQFTDLSSGNITSWSWQFGNNNTSSLQNPTASYTGVGTYTVTLTVSDGTQTASVTKTNYIEVFNPPVADFNLSPSGGCTPLKVDFNSTSSSSSPIVNYIWDFGDGSQAGMGNSPSHTYLTGGTFSPSLEVIDQNGCNATKQKPSSVTATDAPIAGISTSSPRFSCQVPHTVNFINTSTGANLNFLWRFGDGSTSTQTNPSHTYTSFGSYNVTLEVTDPNCGDTLVLNSYINIQDPIALFSTNKRNFCVGDTLFLDNLSTGANFYNWSLDNGKNSSSFEPQFILNDTGKIVITLKAFSGSNCFDEIKDSIQVEQLKLSFTTDSTFSCVFEQITFNGISNLNANLEWRIGKSFGSDTLMGDSVFHISSEGGIYSDTLIGISTRGCIDTLIKTNNREVDEVFANITVNGREIIEDTLKGCLPLRFDFADSSTSNYPLVKWDWNFGNNQTSALQHPGNINFLNKQAYPLTLKVTNSKGCSHVDDDHVVLGGYKQNPGFYFFPDTICYTDSFTIVDTSSQRNLIDSAYYTFKGTEFSFQIGIDSLGLRTKTEDIAGNFAVELKISDNGCDTTLEKIDSILILGPVANPSFSSNCSNRNLVFFNSKAKDYTKFYWDFGDGSPIDSINLNPSHNYSSFRTYLVTLTLVNDTNGCDTNKYDLYVPVGTLPPLNIRPDTFEYCLNQTITIFNADSGFYLSHKWLFDGVEISAKPTAHISFDSSGIYPIELRTEDVFGCTYNRKDTFYISQPKAKIGSKFINSCAPVILDFIDSSETDTTIKQWYWTFGDLDTSYQERDTVQFPIDFQGDVFLRVTNVFGCSDSTTIKDFLSTEVLQVNFRYGNANICVGDSVVFRRNTSGLNPTFEWDFGDGTTISTQNDFVVHYYNQAGNYSVSLTATDQNGCIKTFSQNQLVKVEDYPSADFNATPIYAPCPPLDVNFSDLSTGNVNSWEWQLDQNDPAKSVVENPFKKYTYPGNFDVFLKVTTPNGCSDSILKTNYIQVDGPVAEIQLSSTIACIGETIQFEAVNGSQVQNYYWDFGDGNSANGIQVQHAYDSTGKIYPSLIVDDGNGCSVAIIDSLEIHDVEADFALVNDTACVPAELKINNLSRGANAYQWNFGDGIQSTDFEPLKIYPTAGNYEVQLSISSAIGCLDTITLPFLAAPNVNLVNSLDTGICEGDSILLTAQGADFYAWSPISLLSKPFEDTTWGFPTQDTLFTIIGNNIYNCPDTQTTKVEVISPPLDPVISDTSIIIGESVPYWVFAGKGYLYQWTPPDGINCPNCYDPIFSPLTTTNYELTIKDPFNCFLLNKQLLIEVEEKYSLDVPQVFSPNGDGVNDIIFAKGWGLKELLAFRIYNRFGELVFESSDFKLGWDGTYKGQAQNIETYVYTVEALTFGGEVLRKKGNISLIR